jgi:hypothetical protein
VVVAGDVRQSGDLAGGVDGIADAVAPPGEGAEVLERAAAAGARQECVDRDVSRDVRQSGDLAGGVDGIAETAGGPAEVAEILERPAARARQERATRADRGVSREGRNPGDLAGVVDAISLAIEPSPAGERAEVLSAPPRGPDRNGRLSLKGVLYENPAT